MGKGNNNIIKLDGFSIQSIPDTGGKLNDNDFALSEYLLPKKDKSRYLKSNKNKPPPKSKLNKNINNNNFKSFSNTEIQQIFNFNKTQDIRDIVENYSSNNNTEEINIQENNMSKEEEENNKIEEEFINIENNEEKSVNNVELEQPQEVFEEEVEEDENIFNEIEVFLECTDKEDIWEYHYFGVKFDGIHLRHCNKNKKDRIKRFYVKSYEQNKESRQKSWLATHFINQGKTNNQKENEKSNRTFKPTPKETYEKELMAAMAMSADEYSRSMGRSMEVTTLTQRQINDLLNRELTPEDYELLLLLDNSVKPKTTPQHVVQALTTVKYSPTKHQCDTCMVCLNEFELNGNVTNLRCNHIFHGECINNWLSNHSKKCPICAVEIHS